MNGKLYIGVTKQALNKRFNDHAKAQGKCRGHGANRLISKAIKKYGRENFTIEAIFCSKDYKFLLGEMESYFIKKMNSFYQNGHGYNMTFGGEGTVGYLVTDATKKKISLTKTGKPNNLSSDGRLSLIHSLTGRKVSEQVKTQLRKTALKIGGDNNPRAKMWTVKSPLDEIFKIRGLQHFCKKKGLERNSLKYTLKSGKPLQKGSSKGWQLLS